MMTSSNGMALFLFAHQDDECAAAPWIEEEVAAGNRVACLFLTNGDGGTATPKARNEESASVLAELGVKEQDICFLGTLLGIHDGELVDQIIPAQQAVDAWLKHNAEQISNIYAPDWEGGHADHDAAHLVGTAIAVSRNMLERCWGFSLYNAHRCPRPFFRALSVLPSGEHRRLRYDFWRGLRLSMLCWKYPSQRRTWTGLFPGFLYRRTIVRTEALRRFSLKRVRQRPHSGPLLYERMFGVPAERVLKAGMAILDPELASK